MVCPSGALTLHAAVTCRQQDSFQNSPQGQRSRSNMPTFIWLIELTKIHYGPKLRQNLTSSLQVIGSFLTQKHENSSQGQKSKSHVTKILSLLGAS